MISFIVRMRFAPQDRERVLEAARYLTEASRKEPGCISFIPHEVAEDSSWIVIYEQYRDEAALEAHRASPHFQKYVVNGLYQWMRERTREDLNAIV